MTYEQLLDLATQNTLSIAALERAQAKTDEKLAELAEQSKKSDERLDRVIKKSEKIDEKLTEFIEQSRETDKRFAEFIEQSKKLDERFEKRSEKTDRKLNNLAKMYGDSEKNKGRGVEEYFLRYFENNPFLGDIHFDTVSLTFSD